MAILQYTSLFKDANLQGYWRGENNFNDISPNGYTLTNNNSVTFGTGRWGLAPNFVLGSTQSASIANASCPNLEISGNQTWGAWIKPHTVSPNNYCILAKDKSAISNFRQFYVTNGGQVAFQTGGLTVNFVITTAKLTADSKYFVTGLYDGSHLTVAIYDITGTLVERTSANATGTLTASDQPFRMGDFNAAGASFDGFIDEAFVFNRVLTTTEQDTLANTTNNAPTGAEFLKNFV